MRDAKTVRKHRRMIRAVYRHVRNDVMLILAMRGQTRITAIEWRSLCREALSIYRA